MTTPHYILLIPNDPAMLEGEGYGHRPPVMVTWEGQGRWYSREWASSPTEVRALVIAAEGRVLRSGVSHLAGFVARQESSLVAGVSALLDGWGGIPGHFHGAGTIVLLDADRRPMEAPDAT